MILQWIVFGASVASMHFSERPGPSPKSQHCAHISRVKKDLLFLATTIPLGVGINHNDKTCLSADGRDNIRSSKHVREGNSDACVLWHPAKDEKSECLKFWLTQAVHRSG